MDYSFFWLERGYPWSPQASPLPSSPPHFLFKHPLRFHSPFSFTFHRPLSSSSPLPQDQQDSPNPPQDPPQRRPSFQSVPIQPVSYPLKPKDPAPQQTESSEPQFPRERPPPPPLRRPVSAEGQEESQRGWTREDIRYVKDAPSIEPVSYAPRVAPLPEDKVGDDPGVVTVEERNEEAEKERRMLEVEDEIRKKMEEEKMKVSFPMLIMPKRNETSPVLDLNEAIGQVKLFGCEGI